MDSSPKNLNINFVPNLNDFLSSVKYNMVMFKGGLKEGPTV